MVNLSVFYELNIYSTEGKFIGKVNEIVLNIKKGRISYLKTNTRQEDSRNVGLRDMFRNSMRIVPEEEEKTAVTKEVTIDIPYEVVTAVGDIILVDQQILVQYQADQQEQQKQLAQKKVVKTPTSNP
ncbi:MAG: PRC-barrel domain-containing protein [Methanosphaera sp.]|nr:PRC-barrel domain-containing protein [Methanosphaera sp.]